LLYFF